MIIWHAAPVVYSIRWQDGALWPGTLQRVLPGYTAVTDAEQARPLITPHIAAAGLPPWRAMLFDTLWDTALDRGMQPSGLLLLRLADLTDAIGHSTTGTVKRWAQFCHRRNLWVNVPGKLTPSPSAGSGLRARAYLVLRPTDQPVTRSRSDRMSRCQTAPVSPPRL